MPGDLAARAPRLEQVRGQLSYRLRSYLVDAAITRTGGMLGPVTFFPDTSHPIRPYAVAPWAEEEFQDDVPQMLRALRGDWFCSAFGENSEPYRGVRLPPHGETANDDWYLLGRGQDSGASWIRLAIDLSQQGGRCEASTVLVDRHSVVYQRHELTGLTGPINPGHHATLALPDRPNSGRLSFSRHVAAYTCFEPLEHPETGGQSWLAPGRPIDDLRAAPGLAGEVTDLTSYPAREGYEDIALICADSSLPFAWTALTVPEEGYVWFALRDPMQLRCTLLWFSNGGRAQPPWNGRHRNVLGAEDITAYFHAGLRASVEPNMLSMSGIPTCLHPQDGKIAICYIQGVARIPPGFVEVVDVRQSPSVAEVLLICRSGRTVSVRCDTNFLHRR